MSLSLDDPLIQGFIQTHNSQAGQGKGEDWDFRRCMGLSLPKDEVRGAVMFI